MPEPILDIRRVSVRFGGVAALADVTLHVPQGGVFGMIGPNGAGKTTLFNCISGFVQPERGSEILFRSRNIVGLPIHRIARLGIARTFQSISLHREHTTEDNILSGCHLTLRYNPVVSILGLKSIRDAEAAARRRTREIAELLMIPGRDLGRPAGTLSTGMQKKVEVARALARQPALLLLDEPGGGLNERETEDLVASLRLVAADPGLTIVIIDHDMSLIMTLCDQVSVLNFGRLIALGSPATIQDDPAVIETYLGAADAA